MDSKNLASGQWPNKPRETERFPQPISRVSCDIVLPSFRAASFCYTLRFVVVIHSDNNQKFMEATREIGSPYDRNVPSMTEGNLLSRIPQGNTIGLSMESIY